MEFYRYLYYQVYRLLSTIRINPNPKDNAIYFLLIFEGLNVFTLHYLLRKLLKDSWLVTILDNKFFALAIAAILWYINTAFIDFGDVDRKYINSGAKGYLILLLYMVFSFVCFFGIRKVAIWQIYAQPLLSTLRWSETDLSGYLLGPPFLFSYFVETFSGSCKILIIYTSTPNLLWYGPRHGESN